jgi:E3 ubiquitin-protein ligase UBR7
VFSCLDCGEKGVCYGCSISCHAGESNLGTG